MSPLGVGKIPMKFLQATCLEHFTFLFRLSQKLLSQMSTCDSEKGIFFYDHILPAVHMLPSATAGKKKKIILMWRKNK